MTDRAQSSSSRVRDRVSSFALTEPASAQDGNDALSATADTFDVGDELLWQPDRLVVPDAWAGHIPVAFWLVKQIRPSLLVELGTHSGNSYAAFCQSIAELAVPARAFAVDTWQGDEHSGHYGADVFDELHRFNEHRHAGFSTLLRTTFDSARGYFGEGTVDLLHIDGMPTKPPATISRPGLPRCRRAAWWCSTIPTCANAALACGGCGRS